MQCIRCLCCSFLMKMLCYRLVSVIDTYNYPPTSALQTLSELKPCLSVANSRLPEPPPMENGTSSQTPAVSNASAGPPRKRIKRCESSSPLEPPVEVCFPDGVMMINPVHAATVLTADTTPSLSLKPALPLAGRIVGTVWQPVQSQSSAVAVSTSSGMISDDITVAVFFCHVFFFVWKTWKCWKFDSCRGFC